MIKELPAKTMQEIFALVFEAIKVAGFKIVPIKPTEKMLDKGEYVNSEWLNDNAPIGQKMYRNPAEGVYTAMVNEVNDDNIMVRETFNETSST